MSDIFLSYAAADRERIGPLVDALTSQNWDVWWDREISIGKSWDQVLGDALEAAKCVVVVWSRESAKSSWVHNEADEGMRRGILLPVLIDDIRIPLGFKHLEAAQLSGWQGDVTHPEFRQLCRGVWSVTQRQEGRAAAAGSAPDPFVSARRENPFEPEPRAAPSVDPVVPAAPLVLDHVAAGLCYLLGPANLSIFAFRRLSKNRFVRFHAFQSNMFFTTWMVLVFTVGRYLIWPVLLLGFFAWLFLMIVAFMGRTIRVPLLCKIADNIA